MTVAKRLTNNLFQACGATRFTFDWARQSFHAQELWLGDVRLNDDIPRRGSLKLVFEHPADIDRFRRAVLGLDLPNQTEADLLRLLAAHRELCRTCASIEATLGDLAARLGVANPLAPTPVIEPMEVE